MKDLRTKKTFKIYKKHLKNGKDKGCPLCKREPLKAFRYWKIIKNRFPYDRIASVHNMLIPFRHVTEELLTKSELTELLKIKNSFLKNENYNYIMEATVHTKTQPSHFHLHLVKLK
jgi:diadenosine tetraphosphate (Ap4A) HIT family hydrolase